MQLASVLALASALVLVVFIRNHFKVGWFDAVEILISYVTTIIGGLVYILTQLTDKWAVLMIGIATLYMFALNIESHHMSLGAKSWLPKMGLNNGADLTVLLDSLGTANFWIAFVVSLCTSAVCARWWRDRLSLKEAKAAFDEVKNMTVDTLPKNALDIAVHRQKQFKSNGMKDVNRYMWLFLACMGVDIVATLRAYPLLGKNFLVNLPWAVANAVGSEMFIATFLVAWKEMRRNAKPKVEVVRG